MPCSCFSCFGCFIILVLFLWSPSYFGHWPLAIQVFDGISLVHMEVGQMGPILKEYILI
jgi:hypothetical protein